MPLRCVPHLFCLENSSNLSTLTGPGDLSGVTQSVTVMPNSPTSVQFTLVLDGIALEPMETFLLRLDPQTTLGDTTFLVATLVVTIVDFDST